MLRRRFLALLGLLMFWRPKPQPIDPEAFGEFLLSEPYCDMRVVAMQQYIEQYNRESTVSEELCRAIDQEVGLPRG